MHQQHHSWSAVSTPKGPANQKIRNDACLMVFASKAWNIVDEKVSEYGPNGATKVSGKEGWFLGASLSEPPALISHYLSQY